MCTNLLIKKLLRAKGAFWNSVKCAGAAWYSGKPQIIICVTKQHSLGKMATCSGRRILQSSLDGRIFHFLKNTFSHQATLKNHGRIISSHTVKRNFSTEDEPVKPSNRIGGKHTLTMIPGDGVGPELCESVKMVFTAAGVPVEWNEIAVSDIGSYGSKHSLLDVADSLKKTGVAIKGALTTPTSINSQDILSLNQKMKIDLDLFANVVHCKSFAGFKTRHNNIDVIIVREQTEGEYTSLEHETVPGVVEMIKVITRKKSERIAKFAFDYATMQGRKKVTAIHKANIMKLADGMFLNTCEEVSKLYPKIQFQGMIVDNACMQMVSNPQQFDVLVVPNLYGNIIGNVAAGLVGGAGVVPGKSIGSQFAIFEPGARHTYAQMAGRNVANPTAMLLSAADMLDHINLKVHARTVRSAVERTISTGKTLTMDMGGSASTSDFVQAVIANIY